MTLLIDVDPDIPPGPEPGFHRDPPSRLSRSLVGSIHCCYNPFHAFHHPVIDSPPFPFRKRGSVARIEEHLAGCLPLQARPDPMVQVVGHRLRIRADMIPGVEQAHKLLPQTMLYLSLRLLDRSIIGCVIGRVV